VLTKNDIRQELLARRSALSASAKNNLSLKIQKRLLAHLEGEGLSCQAVGLYSPIRNEVETSLLFDSFCQKGVKVFYPKADPQKKTLQFLRVEELSSLEEGAYKIPEPSSKEEAEKLSLLVLPGVSFDEERYRLGYGAGFYDCYLSKTSPFKVGVAFDFQVCSRLPREGQDISCDLVVTESRILRKEKVLC